MILKLFRPTPPADTIARLYGTIVAQARIPAFYQIYGVPDTVAGRLEMIMLHMVLVLRHFERGPASLRALGQGLFDAFCRDLDDNVREIGVGDLAMPRTMRRIGEAFYGRQAVYRAALDASEDERLAAALQRNVFAGRTQPRVAFWLALYVRESVRRIAAQDQLERAQRAFPDPEQVLLQARQTWINP
jgi:cytochrome b pre-mRNA-processing protein 3